MGKKTWTFRSEGKNEIARPKPDKAFYFKDHLITVDNEEDARLLRNMGYEEIMPEELAAETFEKEIPDSLKKKLGPRIIEGLIEVAKTKGKSIAMKILDQMKAPYKEEFEPVLEKVEEIAVYECPECGKKFDSQKALNSHMKVHK